MKTYNLLFIIVFSLFAYSCDTFLSLNDDKLPDWKAELVNNAADGEDMARFLENANIGVVRGGYHAVSFPSGEIVPSNMVDGFGRINQILIDDDGTTRIHSSYVELVGAFDYTWRVLQDDHMVLIFTDKNGNENVTRLVSYSAEDDFWYFEGNFPGFNDVYDCGGESQYDYCVVRLRAVPDPEHRAEVEALYEKAKAENE